MKRLLLIVILGLAGLTQVPGTASALGTFGLFTCCGCRNGCGGEVCIRPYNAFSPVLCGTLYCDGCFPFAGSPCARSPMPCCCGMPMAGGPMVPMAPMPPNGMMPGPMPPNGMMPGPMPPAGMMPGPMRAPPIMPMPGQGTPPKTPEPLPPPTPGRANIQAANPMPMGPGAPGMLPYGMVYPVSYYPMYYPAYSYPPMMPGYYNPMPQQPAQ